MSVQFFICNKQFQLFLTCLHYFICLGFFFLFFLNLDHSFKQKLKNKRMFDGSNVVLLIVLIKKLSVLYKDRSSLLLLLLLIFERKFIYHGSNSDKNKI